VVAIIVEVTEEHHGGQHPEPVQIWEGAWEDSFTVGCDWPPATNAHGTCTCKDTGK
jgi:hypothetical protein